jgi:excisionase family DNA binding protein
MSSLRPEITGSASDLEPLAVSPRQACRLLNLGNTRLYQLIGNGELESYREGRARKITMHSIRARHERQLAASVEPTPRGHHGRPRIAT